MVQYRVMIASFYPWWQHLNVAPVYTLVPHSNDPYPRFKGQSIIRR